MTGEIVRMVRFIPLSGFLGAGKTTTMIKIGGRLQENGHRVAVITNDQGTGLVDTAIARDCLGAASEITRGCFCCRFEDLVDTVQRLVSQQDAEVVIAEAVGSCTDINATVVRPLRQMYPGRFQLAPLTTVVDPLRYLQFERSWARGDVETDVMYLYRKQIEDADIVAVNKADLLTTDDLTELVDGLQLRFPQAEIVTYSAVRGTGLDHLLDLLNRESSTAGRQLDIDYPRYGRAEAHLAWMNQAFELSAASSFNPVTWVRQVLTRIGELCHVHGYAVGHVKAMVTGPDGTTKASLTDSREEVCFDQTTLGYATTANVALNARVECEPSELEAVVSAALCAADAAQGLCSSPPRGHSFKPGKPTPTHRLLPTVG